MARLGLGLFAVGMSALTAAAATAQPAGTAQNSTREGTTAQGIEEVIVTARRKQENLQNIPVSVYAISGETLRQNAITSVTDIQRVAPGLAASASSRGESNPGYGIRGQRGAVTITLLSDPAVGIYFADFAWQRPTGTNQSMYDLQSVQVLKGPQGTLFGRNSTGGAILLEPNRPTDQFGGYVQASVGSYNLRDFEAVVNIPASDHLAIRVAGKSTTRDGYLENVSTGQKQNDIDSRSFRISIAFKPTDDITSTTIGNYFESSNVGAGYKLVFQDPRALNPAFGALGPTLTSAVAAQLATSRALGQYKTMGSMPVGVYDRSRTIQNNTEIGLGDLGLFGEVTLKNIVGYRDITNRYSTDFSGTTIPLFTYQNGRIDGDSFSEEFQIQGSKTALDYILGFYYFQEKGTDAFLNEQLGYLGTFAPTTFPARNRSDADVKNTSKAIFVHGDYKLSPLLDGLSISGGARVTWDDRQVTWHQINSRGVAPTVFSCAVVTGLNLTTPNRNLCNLSAQTEFVEPTYDVSLNYKMTPDVLVYLAHRRGYRSGGFNAVPPPNPTYRSFNPEIVKDIELGLKMDFNEGPMPARINLAAFHQIKDNAQVSISIPQSTTSVATGIVNGASTVLNGGEADLTLEPAPGLLLNASVSVLRSHFKTFQDFQVVGGQVTPFDISDSRIDAYIPNEQWSLSARYKLPVPAAYGDVSTQFTAYGQSDMITNLPTTSNCGPLGNYLACYNAGGNIKGYWLFNFRAEWQNVGNHGVDLAFFVNNFTNKYYENFAFNGLGAGGLTFVATTPGAPRMWGFELRVPFGAERRS